MERKSGLTHSDAIAALALVVSLYSAWVSQKAYEHGIGRDSARLSLEGVYPKPDRDIFFEDLDRMLVYDPSIIVENSGSEPIAAIRVEVVFRGGGIHQGGLSPETFPKMPFWERENLFERKDHTLPSKLLPGRQLRLSISRELMAMMRVLNPEPSGRERYESFEIRCYAKLVGAEAFDEAIRKPGPLENMLIFRWLPSGFPVQRCEAFLKSFNARPMDLDEWESKHPPPAPPPGQPGMY